MQALCLDLSGNFKSYDTCILWWFLCKLPAILEIMWKLQKNIVSSLHQWFYGHLKILLEITSQYEAKISCDKVAFKCSKDLT